MLCSADRAISLLPSDSKKVYRHQASCAPTLSKRSSSSDAWLHPFKEQKLILVGEQRMAVFDDVQPWEEKLGKYAHSLDWHQGVPTHVQVKPEPVEFDTGEPLKAGCQHFIDCITGNKRPHTDGWEGLRVLKVLKLAQQSLDNGSAVIELAQFDENRKEADFFAHPTAVIDDEVEIGADDGDPSPRLQYLSHKNFERIHYV